MCSPLGFAGFSARIARARPRVLVSNRRKFSEINRPKVPFVAPFRARHHAREVVFSSVPEHSAGSAAGSQKHKAGQQKKAAHVAPQVTSVKVV
jgi:hypothetical protein